MLLSIALQNKCNKWPRSVPLDLFLHLSFIGLIPKYKCGPKYSLHFCIVVVVIVVTIVDKNKNCSTNLLQMWFGHACIHYRKNAQWLLSDLLLSYLSQLLFRKKKLKSISFAKFQDYLQLFSNGENASFKSL